MTLQRFEIIVWSVVIVSGLIHFVGPLRRLVVSSICVPLNWKDGLLDRGWLKEEIRYILKG